MYSLIATIKFIKKKKIINEPKHKIDPDLSPFFTNPDSIGTTAIDSIFDKTCILYALIGEREV